MRSREITIASVVAERWRLLLGAIVVGALLGTIATIVQPKVFLAHTKLLVRTGREDAVITSNEASTPAPPREVTEEEVNSEIELLRSHDLLQAVVVDAGLVPSHVDPARHEKQVELAVLNLYKHLDISAIRKSNIIQVGYFTSSPVQATSVLEDLTNRYLSASIAAHGTPDSLHFFADEVAHSRQDLLRTEQAASDFRQTSQIFDPLQERTALVTQLSSTQNQLADTKTQIQEQFSRRRALQSESNGLAERIPTQTRTAVNQPLVEHLEARLNDLQTNRVVLAAKYKADDPLITTVDSQIASTRQQLQAVGTLQPSEQTSDVNPVRQTVAAELTANRVLLQGLAARQTALVDQQKQIVANLGQLDRQSLTLANLDRAQTEAQSNYSLFERRAEESRIAGQMDRQKIANVAIIERPVASPIPVSPSLTVNLFVGMCAGALLGFLLAWLQEALLGRQVSLEETLV